MTTHTMFLSLAASLLLLGGCLAEPCDSETCEDGEYEIEAEDVEETGEAQQPIGNTKCHGGTLEECVKARCGRPPYSSLCLYGCYKACGYEKGNGRAKLEPARP